MRYISCSPAGVLWVMLSLSAKASAQTCTWEGHCLGTFGPETRPDLLASTRPSSNFKQASSKLAETNNYHLGATCQTGDDCSDTLDCIGGVCGGVVTWTTLTQIQTGGRLSPTRTTDYFTLGAPTAVASCAWVGHCAGRLALFT